MKSTYIRSFPVMRSFNSLETKSFLIGFKAELPYTTFNPAMPSLVRVTASRLSRPCRRSLVVIRTNAQSLPHREDFPRD